MDAEWHSSFWCFDRYLLATGDKRPISLVKIDVQGAEMLVLAGAERTISAVHPTFFIEVDDCALERFDSSAGALAAMGYRTYELADKGAPRAQSLKRLLLT